jgi:protein-tyrosine phosphatase
MGGYIDLHCHWVVGIDDGVKTVQDSRDLLAGLGSIGFAKVVATPHMRPGMFDNAKADLTRAYEETEKALGDPTGLPARGLSSEHYFDDVVFERIMRGEGLPYPGGRAILVEFYPRAFPIHLNARFFDLRRKRLRPVIAHPERYEWVWDDATVLDGLIDAGAAMLLDVAALAGKYGRTVTKCAEKLLEEGYYDAACSDAHGPRDVEHVAKGIEKMQSAIGAEDARAMLVDGPLDILEGRLES